WSCARLHAEAFRAARALADAEIPPGGHVVVWAASSPEWVGWLFGAALRGLVVVPVDADSSPAYARQIADRVDARLVLHGAGQDASGTGRPCLPVDSLACLPAADPAALALSVQPDDPALIYFTSGTTAKPRGVVLTHRNLTSQLARFRPWRPLVRLFGFRLLTIAPLSHIQGMMLGVCIPLYVGLGVFYTHALHPAHLVRTLADNRVTLLATVPRVLHLLGKALCLGTVGNDGRNGVTLGERLAAHPSHFQRCQLLFRAVHRALGYQFWVVFVGGSALPREDEELWNDAGCFVIQGYGLTETAAMISVNAPVLGRRGSIGRPLAHQEVRIAEDGEVLVRGPNVSPGYYDDPESNRQAYVDGFLRTGDLVRRDADNHLFFAGRKKEMLVTGEGFNVYPDDVEAVLVRQPGVRDAAVIAVEREGHAEIHAVLLLAPETDPAAAVRQANADLEPHQRIRGWSIWPEPDFPRTSLLKVRRAEVAAHLHREGAPDRPAAASPDLSLADVLA
ncbi:MAG: AMP-binding protein, partial [Thermoanaerobaculia bacterium]